MTAALVLAAVIGFYGLALALVAALVAFLVQLWRDENYGYGTPSLLERQQRAKQRRKIAAHRQALALARARR